GTFQGLQQIAGINSGSNAILLDNGWATGMWANAYRTINMCNIILQKRNLDLITSSPTNKAQIEAQARFIRGSLYFELARLYGKTWGDGDNNTNLAVPLILRATPYNESELTSANYPARASVAAIYNRAIIDIDSAELFLNTSGASRATVWAAKMQRSRIALMQQDFVTARNKANEVIQSGPHSLATDFNNLWFNYIEFGGVAPREYIFYMLITTQDGTNGLNTYYGGTISSISGTAGRLDMDVQAAWLSRHESFSVTSRALTGNVATLTTSSAHNFQVGQTVYVTNLDATFNGTYVISAVTSNTLSYSKTNADVPVTPSSGNATGDVRRTYFTSASGRRLTNKHLDRFGHVPVMRLAEAYLTRAEANFRLGTSVGDTPLNDVNRIRNRAGLANKASIASVDEILLERDLELAFEGHFMHDNKRNGKAAPGGVGGTTSVPFNDFKLIFPIPQRETDVNKNLVQNAGY
ncbi:MAG TPA: hypothetical protein DCE81_06385, partial [Cytophagales bacterium]|nr:hypothetical protein [Cytophagales bacterium]